MPPPCPDRPELGHAAAVADAGSPAFIHELATLVPGFMVMAAITPYGIYPGQFLVLLASTGLATITTSIYSDGWAGVSVDPVRDRSGQSWR